MLREKHTKTQSKVQKTERDIDRVSGVREVKTGRPGWLGPARPGPVRPFHITKCVLMSPLVVSDVAGVIGQVVPCDWW